MTTVPCSLRIAHDKKIEPGETVRVFGQLQEEFKGTHATAVEGIDYRAFKVMSVFVGIEHAWRNAITGEPWPALLLLAKWDRPMSTAFPGKPISITVKNISSVDQSFAIDIVGQIRCPRCNGTGTTRQPVFAVKCPDCTPNEVSGVETGRMSPGGQSNYPSKATLGAQCDRCGRPDCSLAGGLRSEAAYESCLDATAARLRALKSVRLEVWDFAIEMERVLRDNDHKGGWDGEDPEWLRERLEGERAELRDAVALGIRNNQNVLHETIDIGNFAMMLADQTEAMGKELPTDLADLRAAIRGPAQQQPLVDRIRERGWSVAVHNDYRIGNRRHTFWLFTRDSNYPREVMSSVKGEGETDAEALEEVWQKIREFEALCEAPLRGGL